MGPPSEAQAYSVYWFSVVDLFWKTAELSEIDGQAKAEAEEALAAIAEMGLEAIGTSSVWSFPPSVEAPTLPQSKGPFWTAARPVEIQCLPQRGSSEYLRLTAEVGRLFGTLAREFPQVGLWVIGDEPNLIFHPCQAESYQLKDYAAFFVDLLSEAGLAIKKENAKAEVWGHFLGRPNVPIELAGEEIQPAAWLELLEKEIGEREGALRGAYDGWMTDLVPELLEDRFEEPTPPLELGGFSMLSSGSGWQTKWLEEFTTNTSDLVTNYSAWNAIRTNTDDVLLTTIPVSGGLAQLRMEDPSPGHQFSVGGAVTHPNEEVVPTSQEFNCEGPNCNKWTAVHDFYPVAPGLDPAGAHVGVFFRVNDREWLDDQNDEQDDQTRFGTILYGEVDATNLSCASTGLDNGGRFRRPETVRRKAAREPPSCTVSRFRRIPSITRTISTGSRSSSTPIITLAGRPF